MIKIPHTDLHLSRLALGYIGLGGGWAADTNADNSCRQAQSTYGIAFAKNASCGRHGIDSYATCLPDFEKRVTQRVVASAGIK